MAEKTHQRGKDWITSPVAEFRSFDKKDPKSDVYLYIEYSGIKIKAAQFKGKIAVLVYVDELLFSKFDGMHHGERKRHEFRKKYDELPPIHKILDDVIKEAKDSYFQEREAFSIGIFKRKSEMGEVFDWEIDPF